VIVSPITFTFPSAVAPAGHTVDTNKSESTRKRNSPSNAGSQKVAPSNHGGNALMNPRQFLKAVAIRQCADCGEPFRISKAQRAFSTRVPGWLNRDGVFAVEQRDETPVKRASSTDEGASLMCGGFSKQMPQRRHQQSTRGIVGDSRNVQLLATWHTVLSSR
jgi:hypothetical protein